MMNMNRQVCSHSQASFRSWSARAALFLGTALLAGNLCVLGQEVEEPIAVGRQIRIRERLKQRFPEMYEPTFAKLELLRWLPEGQEKVAAPFKSGSPIRFQLRTTNTSQQELFLPAGDSYIHSRPQLFKGEELIPYCKEASEQVRAKDAYPRYRSTRYEPLKPGQALPESIDLAKWYEPLPPGHYRLTVRRRYIWGGEWVEAPPLLFQVIP